MSILKKLFTALRGGATEVGEAIVDSQALRILDQEIRDAHAELDRSRGDLTKIMAQRKLTADKLEPKQAKAAEYQGYAKAALAKGDEALALEVAGKLAELEGEIAQEAAIVGEYERSIETLKRSIKQAETTIARLKQQVDTVKATESVQRAQSAIAARHSGHNASLRTALDSLERIKSKQKEAAAQMDAAAELASEAGADTDLEAKLRQAGLKPEASSAQAVLERLKSQA
ncbi:MAG: PspA/IM30 family protein [Gammaproteobacteria bacterium]|nr:PspA/IM30 family protein [Gammaproteobacteria bacterium]